MATVAFDKPFHPFGSHTLAAAALVPWRAEIWTIAVGNSDVEIRIEGKRWLGQRAAFLPDRLFFSQPLKVIGDAFKKSVKQFRLNMLDVVKCGSLILPKQTWAVDGQHRWVATRAFRSLSYRHSRRLFRTVTEVIESASDDSANVWKTLRDVFRDAFKKSSIVVKSPIVSRVTFSLCKFQTDSFAIHTGISPPAGMLESCIHTPNAGGIGVSILRSKIERDFPNRGVRRVARGCRPARLLAVTRLRSDPTVLRHRRVRPCPKARPEQIRRLHRSMETDIRLGLGSQLRRGTLTGRHLSGGGL